MPIGPRILTEREAEQLDALRVHRGITAVGRRRKQRVEALWATVGAAAKPSAGPTVGRAETSFDSMSTDALVPQGQHGGPAPYPTQTLPP